MVIYMNEYKTTGYLHDNFRIFHLSDTAQKEFSYHYHDFNKILILLNGNVTYTIEGRSYELQKNDIIFVNAGEVLIFDINKEEIVRFRLNVNIDFVQNFTSLGVCKF